MWETNDPEGLRVVLTAARWHHIVERHSEFPHLRSEVLRTVDSPGLRRPGRDPGEEWFFLEGVGPSQ